MTSVWEIVVGIGLTFEAASQKLWRMLEQNLKAPVPPDNFFTSHRNKAESTWNTHAQRHPCHAPQGSTDWLHTRKNPSPDGITPGFLRTHPIYLLMLKVLSQARRTLDSLSLQNCCVRSNTWASQIKQRRPTLYIASLELRAYRQQLGIVQSLPDRYTCREFHLIPTILYLTYNGQHNEWQSTVYPTKV